MKLGIVFLTSLLMTGCLTVGVSYDQNGTQFSAGYSDGKTIVSAIKDGRKIMLKVDK
jgi:hypothetical protein